MAYSLYVLQDENGVVIDASGRSDKLSAVAAATGKTLIQYKGVLADRNGDSTKMMQIYRDLLENDGLPVPVVMGAAVPTVPAVPAVQPDESSIAEMLKRGEIPEQYKQFFTAQRVEKRTEKIQLVLTPSLCRAFKKYARKEKISLNEAGNRILEQALKGY